MLKNNEKSVIICEKLGGITMEKSKQEQIYRTLEEIDINPEFVIRESFLGYKYRKGRGKLYENDAEIPNNLIRLYYGLGFNLENFNALKKVFITHYIKNESELERVDIHQNHSNVEIQGLRKMYEYIHSDDIDYMFNIYTLKELHEKLFSLTEFPECAGEFRKSDAYLSGTGTNLAEWTMIRPLLNVLDEEVQTLLKMAPLVKEYTDVNLLFEYINRCVILKCKIIQIHPFIDGNGRVTRGFTNKLFEYAGLPPIYIKSNERKEYQIAMHKTDEDNYHDIINFYKYKICDSIIELDINERMKLKKEDFQKKINLPK